MDGGFLREVVDLVAAGRARSYYRGGWIFFANLGKEASFADLAGDVEVFF